jgi:hypothetical protein
MQPKNPQQNKLEQPARDKLLAGLPASDSDEQS